MSKITNDGLTRSAQDALINYFKCTLMDLLHYILELLLHRICVNFLTAFFVIAIKSYALMHLGLTAITTENNGAVIR